MPSSLRPLPSPVAAGSAVTVRWEQLIDGRPVVLATGGEAQAAGHVSAAVDASSVPTAAVQGLGSGDFVALVNRWSRPLFRFHWSQCQDVQQTEDWVQETFKRAWQRRATLRDTAAARGWLFGIAVMLHREHFRHWNLERRHFGRPVALSEDIEAEPSVADWDSRLQRALGVLSEEDRRLVLLIGAQGLNQRDVAAMLGLHESVIQKRWQRATARLAANLTTVDPSAPTGLGQGSGFREKEGGR